MDNYFEVKESMYQLVLDFLEEAKRIPLGMSDFLAPLPEEELRFIQNNKYYVKKALYNSAGFKKWASPEWEKLDE